MAFALPAFAGPFEDAVAKRSHYRSFGIRHDQGQDDFASMYEVLKRRGVDTAGIEHVAGKSFHWTGSYNRTLNEADTLATELHVFETFAPKIPKSYLDSEYLFLANIDPVLQRRVLTMAQGEPGWFPTKASRQRTVHRHPGSRFR